MKKIILIAFTSLLLIGHSFGAEKHIIKAKIKNLKDQEIVVKIYDITAQKVQFDTTINCKNGTFTFDKTFEDPVYATFTPTSGFIDTKQLRGVVPREAMTIDFYMIENECYTIKGSVEDNSILYSIEGSEINSVISNLKRKYIEAHKYYDLETEYFRDELSKEKRDSVYEIGTNIFKKMKSEKLDYLKSNLKSQLSGLFLSEQEYDDFDKYYTLIDEGVRDGLFKNLITKKKHFSDLVANHRKVQKGVDGIDFTLKSIDGESVTLSKLRGNYVLLYFWGSW